MLSKPTLATARYSQLCATRRSRPIGSRISGKTEMSKSRRFPPRWSIEELNNACFIVRDKAGHRIAYFCFDDEPGRRSAANMLKPR